ncbi:MAG TPA: hypothetical protein VNI57_05460 [Candidatus Saccharimonadales bacterium]|nr:hypothetical protein [Candidatus Saccharimonadales bacterium]
MKKPLLFLAIAAMVVAAPFSLHVIAAEGHGDTMVKGEILDMACYLGHGAKGADHAGCALKCLKSGQPMGLLADDGTVYLLTASHGDPAAFNQAKDLAGKKVEITGAESEMSGIKGIEVHAVKAM